ncbi:MAG: TIGR04283 family arsenosugar biosynthesis glycosyltransferase [Gammaproteobacteria bacterium]
MKSKISIVIPVLNEEKIVRNNITRLNKLKTKCDVLFVDGQSIDDTVNVLKENQQQVVTSPIKGRGAQLAYGAKCVNEDTELILFLHIDTELPTGFELKIRIKPNIDYWGRFDIKLDSNKKVYKMIQVMMNLRSRITGIATGDQAIFVTKNELLNHVDKLKEHPLMEDIYLSKVLKAKLGRAYIIKDPVITSIRYWEKNGIFKTILKMWKFRLMYFFNISPKTLYKRYYL